MRRIAIINQKGGVGKTTSCCNVGATIAAAGHRVLLLDLDPQAHLTMHLGVEPDGDKPSIYNVLTDNLPLAEAAVEVRENLAIVPSHIDLAAAEMELVSVMGREVILRDALQKYTQDYDYLLMDCPPSLGVLTINGLAAVNEIIVPMQPHFLALQGVGKLLETIGLVRSRINPDLKVSGIILCMYEAGTRLAGEVSADLAAFLEQSRDSDVPWANAVVYSTIIRRNIKLAECPSHGQTITEYAPQSNGAIDYAALTAEIMGVDAETLRPTAAAPARKPRPQAATGDA
ncbi:MAG TPA: AAA family ATPase, partial [Phycisphaerae bacterium]|nr:AAA family ATPase [Phycisphaerae bacterium]